MLIQEINPLLTSNFCSTIEADELDFDSVLGLDANDEV